MRMLKPRAAVGGLVASRVIMPDIQRPTFVPSSSTSPCIVVTGVSLVGSIFGGDETARDVWSKLGARVASSGI